MNRPPKVNRRIAARVFEYHFKKKPQCLEQLHGGLNNFVCEARLGRDEFILRISDEPSRLQTFMKEQWAVARAREKGVPTPEILEVSNEAVSLPYMISHKIDGVPALTHPDRLRILRELGRYGALINQIPTSDFGPVFNWSSNKLSRNRTWREYLEGELDVFGRIKSLQQRKLITSATATRLRKHAKEISACTRKPTLNHGDLRLKNVMLDAKGGIKAILDWEECTSNLAPYWELSIALHDLGIDEKEAFLQGYGISPEKLCEAAPFIKLFNAINYWMIVHESRGNKNEIARLATRFSGALDLFSL